MMPIVEKRRLKPVTAKVVGGWGKTDRGKRSYPSKPPREKRKPSADLAKITRPAASGILFRERLFQRLEDGENYPVVWICGPAGSGKTAFMSSYIEARQLPCLWYTIDCGDSDFATFFHYLGEAGKRSALRQADLPCFTADYRLGVPGFNHDFFTRLFSALERPSILIFDNYQEISEELPLHDLILDALNWLPESLKVIIISRSEPSAKFSRFRANRRLKVIDWQELRFTSEEARAVISQQGFAGLPQETLRRLHDKTDGWIAGLLFMIEGIRKYGRSFLDMEEGAFNGLFSYLAEETFDYQDSDIKLFLLKTSLLPNLTTQLARDLTGNPFAAEILTFLNRSNLFIEKRNRSGKVVHQYHPLFREFLSEKIKDFFTDKELLRIKKHAAILLLDDRQFEAAVEFFLMTEGWDEALGIILHYAPMLLSQGKNRLMGKWLLQVPQEKYRDNLWLSYWLGMSLQPLNPPKAREILKKTFEDFYRQQDMTGAFAAWIGLVDAIISEWSDFTLLDPMINWFESHYAHESAVLSKTLKCLVAGGMTGALLVRYPQHPDLPRWVEHTLSGAYHINDVDKRSQLYLVAANYFLWRGDQSNCQIVLGKVRRLIQHRQVSTTVELQSMVLEAGMHVWFLADSRKCLQIVADGLQIAESTGVKVWNHMFFVMGFYGALTAGDYSAAADFLEKIESGLDEGRRHCFFCHHYLSAWSNMLHGNILCGVQHAQEALWRATETGYVLHEALGRYALAQLLFAKGEFQNASAELTAFGKIARVSDSRILQYMFLLAKAHFFLDLGKERLGVNYLQKAMELGRQEGYRGPLCWWDPEVMTRLCMKALEADIEIKYVQELIGQRGLVPIVSPIEIEQWPWPVKIFTLGRFEIVIGGKPIRFQGKAQQKPLALLKALIAFQGRNVAVLRLADALWPDADGDMQHQALATTLHRLRIVLGGKEAIEFLDGKLSLNPRYCWLDAWAFERLLSRAETEAGANDREGRRLAVTAAGKALDLYHGDFLPQLNEEYWCINMRERLKSRFLRGVLFLAHNLEQVGEREKAIERYLQALEVDPRVEQFYQRLMVCYSRMGRNAEAVAVYKRCRKNLDIMLKVEPSASTKAIYRTLLAGSSPSPEIME